MTILEARRSFAALIDEARRRQHLSIRDLARIADVAPATAQGWLNGQHFPVPALRPNYLRVVDHLGLSDQLPDELWDEPWSELQPRLGSGKPPYLGLRSFGAADRDLYFGRDNESRRLAETVRQLKDAEGHGLIVVVGASGSGKSSLLGAGLVGKEAVDGILAGCPVAQLGVEDLAQGSGASATLVVVDQFEEALGLDEQRRAATLAAVAAMAARSIVVIGLRADAFGAATQEALLVEALARPFVVTPLTRDEVRQVIVGPAKVAGISVEDDLVPVLLDDLAPGPRAGSVPVDLLPLLSNALLVTWAGGRGKRMAVSDYVRAGGVASALQGLAEDVFNSLSAPEQDAARRLFVRLVRISGDVLMRESVALDDIEPAALGAKDAFVTARMLTVSGDAVRISHDALLGHWSRLRGWIDESRVELAVLEQLHRASRVWSDTGRNPDALIPVERLAVFSEWVADPRRQQLLSPHEREFVSASREHFASELAREQVMNRRLRRGRGLAAGLTVLATALALVTGLLYWQGRGLQAQADATRLEAQSRQVALEARSIRADDPNLQAQMSLVAGDLAATQQGQSALLDATSVNTPIRWPGAAGAVIARTGDEKLVARANGSGQVTLWRGDELLTSPGTTFTADPGGGPLYALALATVGGRTLLAVGGGGAAGLWDVTAEPTLVADLRDGDVTAYGAAFAGDGHRLALATSTGEVRLWTVPDLGAPTVLGTVSLGGAAAKAVAFGPADTLLVAGQLDAVARWTLGASPARLPDLTFAYDKAHVISQTIAVSPDGRQLAVGIAGRRVLRWALDGAKATPLDALLGFESWTNDLAYSSDGRTLLAANSDQSAYVFDAASGSLKEKLGGATLVTGVEMVAGRPVTSGADGTLRVWQSGNPVLRTGSAVYAMSTDPAGRFLAASSLYDGINLWDISTDNPTRLPDPDIGGRSMSSAVAVAPNGRYLIGGTTDGKVVSWPLSDGGTGKPAVVEVFPGSYIGAVAVSPDSGVIAVLQYTGTAVALYRADAAGGLVALSTLDTPTPQGVTFSPDGKLLAVPIQGGVLQLWDVSDPTVPKLAGKLENLAALPTTAAFANHSRTLAVGTDAGAVTVWDVTDPSSPAQRKSYGDPHAAVYALTFSPDDATLAAVGGDKLVWAWHLEGADTEAYLALDGHMGRTNDVRFIRDGSRIVVGGDDGTVRTWRSRLDDAHRALCSNRGEALTVEEWARYLPGVTVHDPC